MKMDTIAIDFLMCIWLTFPDAISHLKKTPMYLSNLHRQSINAALDFFLSRLMFGVGGVMGFIASLRLRGACE